MSGVRHQMSASDAGSLTMRLSFGLRPVLAPDKVARAPEATICEPSSYRIACEKPHQPAFETCPPSRCLAAVGLTQLQLNRDFDYSFACFDTGFEPYWPLPQAFSLFCPPQQRLCISIECSYHALQMQILSLIISSLYAPTESLGDRFHNTFTRQPWRGVHVSAMPGILSHELPSRASLQI